MLVQKPSDKLNVLCDNVSLSCMDEKHEKLQITSGFSRDTSSRKNKKRRVVIVNAPTPRKSIVSGEQAIEKGLFRQSIGDLTPPSDLFEHDHSGYKLSPRVAEFRGAESGDLRGYTPPTYLFEFDSLLGQLLATDQKRECDNLRLV